MSIFKRQVDEKHAYVIEFHFDDQTLYAGRKVMESLARDSRRRQNGVALLTYDRQLVVERRRAVLAFVDGVMPEVLRDVLGLINERAAHRPRIDFDQTDEIGILATDELRDVIEHAATAAQIACAGQREMKRRSCPGGVSDVVDEQSQWKLRASEPRGSSLRQARGRRMRDANL